MLEHYPLLRGSDTLTVSFALQIWGKFWTYYTLREYFLEIIHIMYTCSLCKFLFYLNNIINIVPITEIPIN